MEIFGIQFAPLDVPLERRLQTLGVATWLTIVAFGTVVGPLVTLYLLVYTRFWWLTVLYLFWIWVLDKDASEKGGRQIKWVRSWLLWKYFRDYFPLRLEKLSDVELDPEKNYLFCCFPHGLLSIGSFNAFASEWGECRNHFPHHTCHVVTLSQNYFMPLLRDLALSVGGISSSAKSIDYVLGIPGGGHFCALMVGGAEEAFFSKPGCYRVVLKKRKGFVRLALKNGAPLVPVLAFGETDLFDQVEGPRLRRVQEALRRWVGLAPVIPIGRGFFQYSFGLMPRRRKVTTVGEWI